MCLTVHARADENVLMKKGGKSNIGPNAFAICLLSAPQDFWRLIWDYNVKTVVLLGAFEASNEFPMFWPDSEEETIKCDQFKVAFREREDVSFSQNGPSIGVGMDFILQVRITHGRPGKHVQLYGEV